MQWLGEERSGIRDKPGEVMFRRDGALQGDACFSQMPGPDSSGVSKRSQLGEPS